MSMDVHRARHRLRTHVSEHPSLYLPFARRKYPGPSPEVIGPQTRLVIDGYTRCATTFAVYAFQLAQPEPVRMAHHLHAPAQLVVAARRGVPTLALIREPKGAILSQLIREPNVVMPDALVAYSRFYARILPYRDAFVVGEFEEVTRDFGAVVRKLNARFGTTFTPFEHTEENAAAVTALIRHRGTLSKTLLGFESGTVTAAQAYAEAEALSRNRTALATEEAWIPSATRDRDKDELRAQWDSPALARLRDRARRMYELFCAHSGSRSSARQAGTRAGRA
jgi:hypothetical protein